MTDQEPLASPTAGEAPNTRERLNSMLGDMLERPEHRGQIEADITKLFTQQTAVMVLDMSGFSRMTKDRGIVPFLLMIHQMRLLTTPSITEHGGTVIKEEADNLFCLFASAQDAIAASQDITKRLKTANIVLPKDMELYVSIGIGFGPVLNIANQDIWGAEVNLASKLGEDIAKLGDILLTEEAYANLGASDLKLEKETISISGLDLTYYKASADPERRGP